MSNPFLNQDPHPTIERSPSKRKNTNPFADLGTVGPTRILPQQQPQDVPTSTSNSQPFGESNGVTENGSGIEKVSEQLAGLDFNQTQLADSNHQHLGSTSAADEDAQPNTQPQVSENLNQVDRLVDPQTTTSSFQPESTSSTSNNHLNSEPPSSTFAMPTPTPSDSNPTQEVQSETGSTPITSSFYAAPSGPPPPENRPIYQPPAGQPPNSTSQPQPEPQDTLLSDEALARQLAAEQEEERMAGRERRRNREEARRNPIGGHNPQSSSRAQSSSTGFNQSGGGGYGASNGMGYGVGVGATNGHPDGQRTGTGGRKRIQRRTTGVEDNGDGSWAVKDVVFGGEEKRIVTQNLNGPCSLLALTNILLLTSKIQITPPDRPSVTYDYLASLIADYLLERISTNPKGEGELDLGEVLNLLPKTQKGLNVNVSFGSVLDFVSTSTGGSKVSAGVSGNTEDGVGSSGTGDNDGGIPPELALFKLCGIKLVHGWLADSDDKETWKALTQASKTGQEGGDYDSSIEKLVEISSSSTSSAEAQQQSDLIKNYLDSTSTQLTYPGLFSLSSILGEGELVTFFRNSHLSVLYRRKETENPSASGNELPRLFTLVTDSSFLLEDSIVWESLEDVDGENSTFFDGKFRKSNLIGGDFVGANRGFEGGMTEEEADEAYARQLQAREDERLARSQSAGGRRAPPVSAPTRNGTTSNGGRNGGLGRALTALGGGRRNQERSRSGDPYNERLADANLGAVGVSREQQELAMRNARDEMVVIDANAGGKKKWWKKVF